MSLLKLQTALGGFLIVAAAGTLNLRAQTPDLPDNSSTISAAIAVSTTEPKKVETGVKSEMPAVSAGLEERSEIKPGAGDSKIAVEQPGSTENVPSETSVSASQGTAAPTDEWQFQFTPYLWIVSISGRAGIGPLVIDTDTSLSDPGVELNFGFMSTFEARKNKFVILTDLQYSNLSSSSEVLE